MPVRVLAAATEVQQHRALWTSWPGNRDSDIDFFLYIAGVRPEVLSPHVFVAYRGEIPEAMLVGRLEERRIPVKFGYLRFQTPRMRVLDFVYGAFRGNPSQENIDLLVSEVLRWLRQRRVDLVILEPMPVDSYLYQATHLLSNKIERGLSLERKKRHCLRLPENSEALYKLLPPKHRQVYRGKGRKIAKDFAGDVKVKCHQDVTELDSMFRDVNAIAQKTYHRGLGFGFQDTPEMRGRCELAARKGWLRVYVLYLAGQPCAYWNAMAYCGTLCGDHIGYDPAFSRYSPGIYLSLHVISDLCDHQQDYGIRQVDFGIGDAEYKTILSNYSVEEGPVYLYGRTLRGLGTNLVSTPLLLADRTAKKWLAQGGLLAKSKRLWRNRATANTASHDAK